MSDIKRKNLKLGQQIVSYLQLGNLKGSKPVLVWLHGWGSEAAVWKNQMIKLANEGFESIALDWPGNGFSQKPIRAFALSDYATILQDLVTELQLTNYHLIAHSFGARVIFVANAEGKINPKKVVIIGGAGLRDNSFATRLKRWVGGWGGSLVRLPVIGLLLSPLARMFRSRDYSRLDGVMADTFRNFIGKDLRSYVSKLLVPTKLIWGEVDQETPLSDAKEMNRLISESTLVSYPEVGHYVFLERPDEVAEEILLFLHQS